MQEERFEVFFQNISGLYRAVQRLRAQFADAAGVSAVHLFWLYLLREYPEGLAASGSRSFPISTARLFPGS